MMVDAISMKTWYLLFALNYPVFLKDHYDFYKKIVVEGIAKSPEHVHIEAGNEESSKSNTTGGKTKTGISKEKAAKTKQPIYEISFEVNSKRVEPAKIALLDANSVISIGEHSIFRIDGVKEEFITDGKIDDKKICSFILDEIEKRIEEKGLFAKIDELWKKNQRLLFLLIDNRNRSLNTSMSETTEAIKKLNDQPLRFINELIQNADDCEYEHENNCFKMVWDSRDRSVTVQYPENGFTYRDIIAISGLRESTKTKKKASIGEKGLGFKGVFEYFGKVHIESAGYIFNLDKGMYSPSVDKSLYGIENLDSASETIIKFVMSDSSESRYDSLVNDVQYTYGRDSILRNDPVLFTNKLSILRMEFIDEESDETDWIEITNIDRHKRIDKKQLSYENGMIAWKQNKPKKSKEALDSGNDSADSDSYSDIYEDCADKAVLVTAKIRRQCSFDGEIQKPQDVDLVGVAMRISGLDEDGEYSSHEIYAYAPCDISEARGKSKGHLYTYLPTSMDLAIPFVMHAPFKLNDNRSFFSMNGFDATNKRKYVEGLTNSNKNETGKDDELDYDWMYRKGQYYIDSTKPTWNLYLIRHIGLLLEAWYMSLVDMLNLDIVYYLPQAKRWISENDSNNFIDDFRVRINERIAVVRRNKVINYLLKGTMESMKLFAGHQFANNWTHKSYYHIEENTKKYSFRDQLFFSVEGEWSKERNVNGEPKYFLTIGDDKFDVLLGGRAFKVYSGNAFDKSVVFEKSVNGYYCGLVDAEKQKRIESFYRYSCGKPENVEINAHKIIFIDGIPDGDCSVTWKSIGQFWSLLGDKDNMEYWENPTNREVLAAAQKTLLEKWVRDGQYKAYEGENITQNVFPLRVPFIDKAMTDFLNDSSLMDGLLKYQNSKRENDERKTLIEIVKWEVDYGTDCGEERLYVVNDEQYFPGDGDYLEIKAAKAVIFRTKAIRDAYINNKKNEKLAELFECANQEGKPCILLATKELRYGEDNFRRFDNSILAEQLKNIVILSPYMYSWLVISDKDFANNYGGRFSSLAEKDTVSEDEIDEIEQQYMDVADEFKSKLAVASEGSAIAKKVEYCSSISFFEYVGLSRKKDIYAAFWGACDELDDSAKWNAWAKHFYENAKLDAEKHKENRGKDIVRQAFFRVTDFANKYYLIGNALDSEESIRERYWNWYCRTDDYSDEETYDKETYEDYYFFIDSIAEETSSIIQDMSRYKLKSKIIDWVNNFSNGERRLELKVLHNLPILCYNGELESGQSGKKYIEVPKEGYCLYQINHEKNESGNETYDERENGLLALTQDELEQLDRLWEKNSDEYAFISRHNLGWGIGLCNIFSEYKNRSNNDLLCTVCGEAIRLGCLSAFVRFVIVLMNNADVRLKKVIDEVKNGEGADGHGTLRGKSDSADKAINEHIEKLQSVLEMACDVMKFIGSHELDAVNVEYCGEYLSIWKKWAEIVDSYKSVEIVGHSFTKATSNKRSLVIEAKEFVDKDGKVYPSIAATVGYLKEKFEKEFEKEWIDKLYDAIIFDQKSIGTAERSSAENLLYVLCYEREEDIEVLPEDEDGLAAAYDNVCPFTGIGEPSGINFGEFNFNLFGRGKMATLYAVPEIKKLLQDHALKEDLEVVVSNGNLQVNIKPYDNEISYEGVTEHIIVSGSCEITKPVAILEELISPDRTPGQIAISISFWVLKGKDEQRKRMRLAFEPCDYHRRQWL